MNNNEFYDLDDITQAHIIELGLYAYCKNKEFIETHEKPKTNGYDSVHNDNDNHNDNDKKKHIKQAQVQAQAQAQAQAQVQAQEKQLVEQMKANEYLRQELEKERRRCDVILDHIQTDTERQIKYRTEELQKQITELTAKNQWYYKLYEDKSKGKHYEEALYPKLLDYNDTHCNSVWTITHVGSVLSEKTDFHFRHKDIGYTVLLDTKNNLPTNPVASTAEFERDVCRNETGAIGGIMLANGNICNKKRFEINKLKDKYLVYVSGFDRDNVSYVFSLLDMICEFYQQRNGATFNKEALRTMLVSAYKRECAALDANDRARKTIQKTISTIVDDYRTHFEGEDIEFAAKTDEVATSSVRVKEKTAQDMSVDFEELEAGRKVVGARSKYYLQTDGVIQYFKNNYARNQKLTKIKESPELIIDMS
jgi:hypothetical protein